ncbi:MAG: hypothetical protein HY815_16225 [Candidatus Riflebacteria bacterium]|nr:hypothetical protein [Candidatus Riflebacteria bacterium]
MSSRSSLATLDSTFRPVLGETGLVSGQHFLFADGPVEKLSEQVAALVKQAEGGRVLPLWNAQYRLQSVQIAGPLLTGVELTSVSTDKDLYREEEDTVTVLVVDPCRADDGVELSVTRDSRAFRAVQLHLDWNGMAVCTLGHLLAGKYEARVGSASTGFEVAGYSLAAASGHVAESVMEGDALACTLDLSTLTERASGRVRVVVLENGRAVHGPVELDSLDGVCKASFPLQGEGPFVAHVTGIDDPGLDVQVPLRGTAREERERTWISRLGVEFWASVLPMREGRACRGLWLKREGMTNAPLKLEDPVGDVGRIEARVRVDSLVLTMLHPGERRVQHRRLGVLESGQSLEFGVQPPFSVAVVGGFVEGRPWEGQAALLPPAELGLEVQADARARPRSDLPVTIRTRRPGSEASVFLVVRDSRLKPMDHPSVQLATGIKSKIEQLTRPRPTPFSLLATSYPSPRWPKLKLGETLIQAGFINQSQMREAMARQRQTGKRLGQILTEMKVVTEKDITAVLSKQLNLPFIDLFNYIIDPAIAKLVPEHIAQRHQLIPINKVGNTLTVAMVDPLNVLAIDDIQLMTGLNIRVVVAAPSHVQAALQDAYGASSQLDKVFGDIAGIDLARDSSGADDLDSLGELGENDAPIIRLVNLIVTRAVRMGATEIHLEPGVRVLKVLYRVDGLLRLEMEPPKGAQQAIFSRVKEMAQLDRSVKTMRQRGRLELKIDNRAVDLVVETAPGPSGERIRLHVVRTGETESRESLFDDLEGLTGPVIIGGASGGARDRFPEVVFAGLIRVRGETRLTVPLGDTLGTLELDVFAMHRGDWESATRRLDVVRPSFGELTLPQYAHSHDQVHGRLDVAWETAPVEISLTRDGEAVELMDRGKPFDAAAVTGPGHATLTFPVGPGQYECTVREPGTGAVDRSVKDVLSPGQFRGYARTLRLLLPGESLSPDDLGALSLRVLPGWEPTFKEVCQVTAGYEHLCCVQTAAKMLAAIGCHKLADTGPERERAESIFLAGVDRERQNWVRGQGFRLYPSSGLADSSWGRIALEHLLTMLPLEEGAALTNEMASAFKLVNEMVDDLATPYRIAVKPRQIDGMHDAYRAVLHGTATNGSALRFIDDRLHVDGTGVSVQGVQGHVATRAAACNAAAALLRSGSESACRRALSIVDWVGRQRGAHGAYYSTQDSAAAILLLHELGRSALAGLAAGKDQVSVNGKRISLDEAAGLAGELEVVKAIGRSVLVEAEVLQQHDWTRFRSNLPVSVSIVNPQGARPPGPGDRVELAIEIEKYRTGDLAHVCLPAGLARIHGGGRVQSFTVDFEGNDRLRVPLAVVSAGPGQGPVTQHFFACVRNMFEEERIGNPGLLEVALAAA